MVRARLQGEPEPQVRANPENRQPEPVPVERRPGEEWDSSANIRLRRLRIGADLRKTEMFKHFDTGRAGKFDALSIHKMARECEKAAATHGATIDFSVTKWTRSGNVTHVEGLMILTSVDNADETYSLACLGEAADNGDKGVNKAVSSARKNGLTGMFNLSVGIDVEDEDTPAAPEAARQESEPQQQPTPQQQPQQQGGPLPGWLRLKYLNGNHQDCDPQMFFTVVSAAIITLKPAMVDAFLALNQEALRAFWHMDQNRGNAIRQMAEAQKQLQPAA